MRIRIFTVLILIITLGAAGGMVPQGRRIVVENQSSPGKQVLRLEVVDAITSESQERTLVICFRVMPMVGAKQGVSGTLEVKFDGNKMQIDGAQTKSKPVSLKPSNQDLFIARIKVDATRGPGDLDKLKAYMSSVSYFDP